MEYPEWLGDLEKEDLMYMINQGSKILVYSLNNKLVCSMMEIVVDRDTLKDLKLEKEKVIEYGPMFVDLEYRGNKLQYQMLKELDRMAVNEGYEYAICTICPDNKFSIKNVLLDNFMFLERKKLKRGIRNIYVKKLGNKKKN